MLDLYIKINYYLKFHDIKKNWGHKIAGTVSKVTQMRWWDNLKKKIDMAQMSLEYSVSSLNNSLNYWSILELS